MERIEQRGLQEEKQRKHSAHILPLVHLQKSHMFFPVQPSVHCVAHRDIDSALLNGILSNLLIMLSELSHKSVSSFMASPPDNSQLYVFSPTQTFVLLPGEAHSHALQLKASDRQQTLI